MPNNFRHAKLKRLEKLSKSQKEELAFDLINAFSLAKNPTDSALLLHDLLTKKEINNLAKRLRIAKMLIAGLKQEDIVRELHCSYGTVSKVNLWLEEGGLGLIKIINKLPKKKSKTLYKSSYPNPNLPKILYHTFQELGYATQKKRLGRFLDNLEKKNLIDKQVREQLKEEFSIFHHKRKKEAFISSTTSLHRSVEK